jgi:hypothetical protein
LDNSRLYGSFNFLTLRDRAASGLNDGHYSHCLHVDRPSGRQARWETLQLVVSALFPGGFDVEIKHKAGDPLTAENHRLKVMFAAADNNRLSRRELMRANSANEVPPLGWQSSPAANGSRSRNVHRGPQRSNARNALRHGHKRNPRKPPKHAHIPLGGSWISCKAAVIHAKRLHSSGELK